jgi:hypothetical protein
LKLFYNIGINHLAERTASLKKNDRWVYSVSSTKRLREKSSFSIDGVLPRQVSTAWQKWAFK